MTVQDQIESYIARQTEPKRSDMRTLHALIQQVMPGCRLWFLDGRDGDGKVVSNPNIGYGAYDIEYADSGSREFYQVGVSANTTGVSVYVLGIKDRTYLPTTYGDRIGKASVTGYCIRFRSLAGVNIEVLEAAIRDGVGITSRNQT
ncbi:MAG: DUF1801 domain-containing protein [Pseudomonadota bacterium]